MLYSVISDGYTISLCQVLSTPTYHLDLVILTSLHHYIASYMFSSIAKRLCLVFFSCKLSTVSKTSMKNYWIKKRKICLLKTLCSLWSCDKAIKTKTLTIIKTKQRNIIANCLISWIYQGLKTSSNKTTFMQFL